MGMEHDDIVISHTEQLVTMAERLAGLDRRVNLLEDSLVNIAKRFDRQGWILASILGGVVLELVLILVKH